MKKLFIAAIVASLMALAALAHAEVVTMYVCPCGDACVCSKMLSSGPGKCGCDKDMVPMQLMSSDGRTATLCACDKGCEKCTTEQSADPNTCACGKQVRYVSLSGMYVCGCGETCKCNTISAEPGKCGCGKPLVKVD